MNHMYEILARLGWAWTPVAFAVWGAAVYRRRWPNGRGPIAEGWAEFRSGLTGRPRVTDDPAIKQAKMRAESL